MNRTLLALGGALLLVAGLVLWILLRRDEPRAEAHSPDPAATAAPTPATDQRTARADHPHADHPTVTATRATDTPTTNDQGEVKEYEINGVKIRDHRKGDHPPPDLPPNLHPLEGRHLPPTLTSAISNKLQVVLRECAADVPVEARGAKPRLEGTILVSIKDHSLRVTQTTAQLRDVVGASVEPTKHCFEEKSVGLTTPAPDEADLDSYSITITYALL